MKNKNNSRKERNEKIEELKVLKGNMSYTAYFSKDYNEIINGIRMELKEIEESIQEVAVTINEAEKNGADTKELHNIFHTLYEKQQKKERELEEKMVSCKVDFSISNIARELDRLNIDRQNVRDVHLAGSKVNDIIALLKQVSNRSGGWYYTPRVAEQVYRQILGVVECMNHELPMLKVGNEEDLLNRLINRIDELNSEKDYSQSFIDKYKLILQKK